MQLHSVIFSHLCALITRSPATRLLFQDHLNRPFDVVLPYQRMRVTGKGVSHFVPENTKCLRTVIVMFNLLDRYSVPEESCEMVVLSREKEAGSSTVKGY